MGFMPIIPIGGIEVGGALEVGGGGAAAAASEVGVPPGPEPSRSRAGSCAPGKSKGD